MFRKSGILNVPQPGLPELTTPRFTLQPTPQSPAIWEKSLINPFLRFRDERPIFWCLQIEKQIMVSFQFLPLATLSTLFWASRALSANLICKETIVEKWLSLRQTRQLAVHVHLLLRSLIYSATALICLSASDISPEGSALSSLSQNHLCCLYLLHKISRVLAETPYSFQPSKPGTLCAAGGGGCPCEYISWVLGGLGLRIFFAIYFIWVVASFQLDKLCT